VLKLVQRFERGSGEV